MKHIQPVLLVLLVGLPCSAPLLAQTCQEYATKCISQPDGGDCPSIGTWDGASGTCTLTGDLTGEAIEIASDGVTLDGGGYVMTAEGGFLQPYGVYAEQRTGVAVANLTVQGFQCGIQLLRSSGSEVTNNMVSGNSRVGIELFGSSDNVIRNNTLRATGDGVILGQSAGNILDGNLAESNRYNGIILDNSSGNTVTGNIAKENFAGITLSGSSAHNTVSGNTVTGNTHLGVSVYFSSRENVVINNNIVGNAVAVSNGAGVLLLEASNNRFSNNTVRSNSRGIVISYPNTTTYSGGGNEVYNNNFIDNATQALVTGLRSIADAFSKPEPAGGNYWGNWTGPDNDGDGFVDSAYVFGGGRDDLPWAREDGWIEPPDVMPPDIVISSPAERSYVKTEPLPIDFLVTDPSGLAGDPIALLDGEPVSNGQIDFLLVRMPGPHALTVSACDAVGNCGSESVAFSVEATIDSLVMAVDYFVQSGGISSDKVSKSLLAKLNEASVAMARGNLQVFRNKLNDFIHAVSAQTGKHITTDAAFLLLADARYVLDGA